MRQKTKPIERLQTPQEMLIDMYAEMLYMRSIIKRSRGLFSGGLSLKTYDELTAQERHDYRRNAKRVVNNLLMPMISFVVEEVVEEEKEEDPIAEAMMVSDEPLSPEQVDQARSTAPLEEDFFSAKTARFA